MTTHPEVLWAQRSSDTDETKCVVYLTINLPDIHADTVKYELTSQRLEFKAKAGSVVTGSDKEYAFSFDLYGEVDPEASTKRLTTRSFELVLRKKETKVEYWPRLTKDKIKTPYLKTNFAKWVDEDDQDEKPAKADEMDDDMGGMGGMPGMGGMGGMGGMPGMGGMGGMPGMGGMGDMGGMGGMGGMDFEKMMRDAGMDPNAEGGSGGGADIDPSSDSDDDEGPPPLEDATPAAAAAPAAPAA